MRYTVRLACICMKERGVYLKKDFVRTAQTIIWVCLVLLEMAVVCRLDVRAETVREIEQEVWYEDVEGAEAIPDELAVTVSENGQEQVVLCDLQQLEVQTEEWQDGFLLPVTFHAYDADWYQVGERLVPRDDALSFEEYEEYLLAEAGLSAQEYRIDELAWDGESYLDEAGEECRDAIASGWKLVRDYRALYGGNTVWMEPALVTEPEPETTDSEESKMEQREYETVPVPEAEVSIEAAEREETEAAEPEPGLMEKIVKTLLVVIGAVAVWFLLGILILLALWLVKCGKKCYNKKKHSKK